MKNKLQRLIPSLTLACAAMLPLAAQAALVSFDWKAIATANDAAYGVHIGDTMTGTVTYDIATATKDNGNTFSNNSGYQYWNSSVMETTANIGTFHGKFSGQMMIVNDFSMWGGDEFIFRAYGSPVGNFDLTFADADMNTLSSLNLPDAFDGSKFERSYLSIGLWQNNSYATVATNSATIGAPATVPEPASLALLGLGLAGITLLRRRGA